MIYRIIFVMFIGLMAMGAMFYDTIDYESFNNKTNIFDRAYNDSIVEMVKENTINETNPFIVGLYKYIDFIGYVYFQGMKWAMEFGYENPSYNFSLFFILIVLGITVVPIIWVLIFIGIGTHELIKYFKRRKKKNEPDNKS